MDRLYVDWRYHVRSLRAHVHYSVGLTEWSIILQPYGHAWRAERKHLHDHFRQGVVHRYHSTQSHEARAFLRRALDFKGKLDAGVISL